MINVMSLLKKEFKQGDHVIVIHDDTTSGTGELVFGKVTLKKNCCLIGGREFKWDNVLFMAHDGFPCRTLKLNLSNEQLYNIDNTELVLLMRKVLVKDKKPKLKPKAKPEPEIYIPEPSPIRYSCGGGCPFVFENVDMEIINPLGTVGSYWEETLVMQAHDGAKGFMWDIEEEVFDFQVN